MEFVPALALLALIKKGTDWIRIWLPDKFENVVLPVVAWILGVVAVTLFALTDWAEGISFGDQSLATLNAWSQIALGLTLGSGAGVVADAIERSNPSPERPHTTRQASNSGTTTRQRTRSVSQ